MNNLIHRDQHVIWHPYTQAQTAKPPIAIKSAKGAYLYTQDGRRLFDGISSWWVNSHGHCHPHINQALARQAEQLEHVMFANFTHEPAISLAEQLLSLAPHGLSRVFYSDNGSTAVEVAIKMAYQYWIHQDQPRRTFIALEHGYYGDTFGAMAVSARSVFTKPFEPLLFKVLHSPSPCRSEIGHLSEAELTARALTDMEELLKDHATQVAAIIIEPMLQGSGGMRMFTAGFASGIKELALKYNTLLIADEAATGFHRTGPLFACHHENIAPDIMCLAKGLTGGYLPLAATLASEKIYDAFLSEHKADALMHGHSFMANPLACATALASLELFHTEAVQHCIEAICRSIEDGIKTFNSLSMVENARNLGTIAALSLKSPESGYLSTASQKVYEHCLAQGLFIRPLGNVIYLLPPLCSSPEEIKWALTIIQEGLYRSEQPKPR